MDRLRLGVRESAVQRVRVAISCKYLSMAPYVKDGWVMAEHSSSYRRPGCNDKPLLMLWPTGRESNFDLRA